MKIKAIVVMVVALIVSIVVGAVSAQDGRPNRGRNRNQEGVRFEFLQDAADILTSATGLTPQEIREQVQDGATIAELIVANGGDVDSVVAEIVAIGEEKIAEAQANSVIDEDRATAMLENLEERVINFLNSEGRFFDGEFRGNRNPRAHRLVQAVADATGLDAEEVVSQIQDGSSLAEILSANDVDVDTFIDEQAVTFEERLNELVEAERISQEVADARLNLFRVELSDWLNRTVASETE